MAYLAYLFEQVTDKQGQCEAKEALAHPHTVIQSFLCVDSSAGERWPNLAKL